MRAPLCTIGLLPALLALIGSVHSAVIYCYYGGGRTSSNVRIADLPAAKCTHLVYRWLLPQSNGGILVTAADRAALQQLAALRNAVPAAQQPRLLASIGGLSSSSAPAAFAAIANAFLFTEFYLSVAAVVFDFRLDGVEIDWRYPASKAAFSNVVDRLLLVGLPILSDLTITATLPSFLPGDFKDPTVGLPAVNYFIALTDYPISLSQNSVISKVDLSETIVDYHDIVPYNKLLIDVTLGSYAYKPLSGANAIDAANAGPCTYPGPYLQLNNFRSYAEMCTTTTTTFFFDEEHDLLVDFNATFWTGYVDVRAAIDRAELAQSLALAGVTVSNVDYDDAGGNCHLGKWPVLTALNQPLSG